MNDYDEVMIKCTNIPHKDYSWLKDHCYRTLKRPCSPNVRNEHLAVLDLIKEHEEQQWTPVSEGLPEEKKTVIASTKYGVYPEARYTEEDGWEWAYESGADYWEELECVTAWMPLPKLYKPQESKELING